jgi:phosphoribosylformylglycinamidine (FGAM) synthase PurS component
MRTKKFKKRGPKSVFDKNPPLEAALLKLGDTNLTDAEIVERINAIAKKRGLETVSKSQVARNRPIIMGNVEEGIKTHQLNQSIIEKFGHAIADDSGVNVLKTMNMVIRNMVAMQAIQLSANGDHLTGEDAENLAKTESLSRMLESLTRSEKNLTMMVDKVRQAAAAAAVKEMRKAGIANETIEAVRMVIVDSKDHA